jgi:hypothetical protein
MNARNNVGQASRLSHFSNQPLERNAVFKKLETGWPPSRRSGALARREGGKPVLLWLALLLAPIVAPAQSYSIDWHKIAGGGGASTGATYQVTGTIGQPDAGGAMTGGNYSLTGGFWSLISVVQTLGAPTLTITHSDNSVKVLWPYPSTGWTLQQNSDLATSNWTPSGGISNDGVNNFITIISPTGNLFFRLSKP